MQKFEGFDKLKKNITSIKCFSHKSDNDGHGAAAILMYYVKMMKKQFKYTKVYMIDYDNTINTDFITKNDIVFMLDISTTPDVMKTIKTKAGKFIWIDHHKTAIEANKDEVYDGIREEHGKSAALLTWEYLFDIPVPKVVECISKHDLWESSDPQWFSEIEPLNYGLSIMKTDMRTLENVDNWERLFTDYLTVSEVIRKGLIIQEYEQQRNRRIMHNAVESITKDGLNILVANNYGNSSIFDSVQNRANVDAVCRYAYNANKKKWVFSIYAIKDADVSAIAKKYGGGGHINAAGFSIDRLDQFFER